MDEQLDCPVCTQSFPATAIEAHVLSCLDAQENAAREQQMRKDAEFAAQLQDAQGGGSGTSSAVSQAPPRQRDNPRAYAPIRMMPDITPRKPIKATGQTILSRNVMKDKICTLLPERFQIKKPSLAYSCLLHGTSLATLYSKAKLCSPIILLVKDSMQNVFGAFITEPLQRRSNKPFVGTGESFLFSAWPKSEAYRWSGQNSYYVLISQQSLAIGLGGGGYGLWLGDDLVQGSSVPCDTFDNPPLSYTEFFECVNVEVWEFL